jgi:hypothetical protein
MKVLKQVKRDRMWSGSRTRNAVNGVNAESFLGSHFFYDTTRQEIYGLENGNVTAAYTTMPTKRAEELEERIAMQEKLMIKLRADLANARSSYKVNIEERVIPFT